MSAPLRLRTSLRRSARGTAITAIAVALAIIASAVLLSHENVDIPGQARQTIDVAVTDAQGVIAGRAEVRWAGVVVGRVTGVRLREGRPVLTASIDSAKAGGGKVYRDATLRLRPQTALQDIYLDVERRGTPRAGLLAGGHILAAARTRTPVDVSDVLNVFSEDVRSRLSQAIDDLGQGLDDNGAQLRSAFATFVPLLAAQRRLTDLLARRRTVVRHLVTDSRGLFDELGRRDRQVTRLIKAGAATLSTTGARSRDIQATLQGLPPTLSQLRTSLAELDTTVDAIRPALRDLLPAARALPGGLRALRGFAEPAGPALTALRASFAALRPLARGLVPTASNLDSAFTRFAPQAPRVDRITRTLIPCPRAVGKFFAWNLDMLKFGNAENLSASPRGEVTPTSGSQGAVKGYNLVRSIGCADGRPAPK